MSTVTTRPCGLFRPTFFHEVDLARGTLRYYDTSNGFEAVYDLNTHLLVSVNRQTSRIENIVARPLESQLVPFEGPDPVLMSGDLRDTTKASGTTGGGRRNFISVAFARAVRGHQDGFDALHQWAADQGNRPTAWGDYTFSYDGYFGRMKQGGHKYDTPSSDGWTIFRADHLDSAVLFGGAALGEDMALASYCELLKWVSKTFFNPFNQQLQRGWHGSEQKRAMGLVPWFFARASFLGFDTADQEFVDRYLGIRPKEMLRKLVDSLAVKPPAFGAFKPDDRTMVDIGHGEIRGELMFQWAIYFAAIGWIDRSNLLVSNKRWNALYGYSRTLMNEVLWRVMGPGGCSYCFSAGDGFSDADVAAANLAETDKSHVYSLHERRLDQGFGVIRDQPRPADVELMAGAAGLLLGSDEMVVSELLAMLPPRSNMPKWKDLQRYADPAVAIIEKGL